MDLKTYAAAGYRDEVDSKVRRSGYTHSYCFDGTWKPSSFISNADCTPSSGEVSHPSLWRVEDCRHIRAVCRDEAHRVGQRTRTALPGYRGYIPAKTSETVFGARFTEANNTAADQRNYQARVDRHTGEVDAAYESGQGKKGLSGILHDTDLKHSTNYGQAQRTAQQLGFHSGTNLLKDHRVPPGRPRSFSSSGIPGYTGDIPRFKAESHVPSSRVAAEPDHAGRKSLQHSAVRHTVYGRAIPRYAGFIPGQTSETVFGRTFMRNHRTALRTRSYLGA
ncbi:hypothetical protein FOZ61_009354 [Perkinsus olseni]|uniref:Uncharacterized protein n=1 Tax=Perkinsus olseni TaxID=32597 RepID=A0A7J6L2G2_PEROL|nr:hypothetical protein FOZ61_009354 [Perkinsus olseni]KAF4654997.1 hypothetical protein FOL46_008435 [Perkinsus olseni]